jgi:hypothetical protein
VVKFRFWYAIDEHRWLGNDAQDIKYVQHKGTKMFVLSAIAVFSCAKIVGFVLPPKDITSSLGGENRHAHPNKSFQASSQAHFLRAHTEAKGSHTWGF